MSDDELRTKTGRIITEAELDELAAEAERGYDVETLRSAPRRDPAESRRHMTGARIDPNDLPALPPPEYPELYAELPTWALRAWRKVGLVAAQQQAVMAELERRAGSGCEICGRPRDDGHTHTVQEWGVGRDADLPPA